MNIGKFDGVNVGVCSILCRSITGRYFSCNDKIDNGFTNTTEKRVEKAPKN